MQIASVALNIDHLLVIDVHNALERVQNRLRYVVDIERLSPVGPWI